MRKSWSIPVLFFWTVQIYANADEQMVIGLERYFAIIRGEQIAIADGSHSPFTGNIVSDGVVMGYKLRYELEVVDGRPHGREIASEPRGPIILERFWVDGLVHGRETWWENGEKKQQTDYSQGMRQGKETGWYENGELRYVIHWEDNKQNGLETYWHPNGQKASELDWKNGKRTGKKTSWYETGEVECIDTYIDDIPQGVYTCWHKNGVKTLQGNWLNGRKNGLLAKWSPEGQLVDRACYKNGEILNPPGVDLWPEDQPCPPK